MSNQEPKQTFDAVAHEKELEELRKKKVESIDFTQTPEEAEKRKKAVTPPEIQDKSHDCPCGK